MLQPAHFLRLVDVARTIAPECDLRTIGIRPGEKLHETLIGVDDAPYTWELAQYYVIRPAIHRWGQEPAPLAHATHVPDGFSYTSDQNPCWLSPEDLLRTLDGYQLRGHELVPLDELGNTSPIGI